MTWRPLLSGARGGPASSSVVPESGQRFRRAWGRQAESLSLPVSETSTATAAAFLQKEHLKHFLLRNGVGLWRAGGVLPCRLPEPDRCLCPGAEIQQWWRYYSQDLICQSTGLVECILMVINVEKGAFVLCLGNDPVYCLCFKAPALGKCRSGM